MLLYAYIACLAISIYIYIYTLGCQYQQDFCNTKVTYVGLYVLTVLILRQYVSLQPIPVAARCKVYICGRSHAGIVGSNPAGGMDVFHL